MNKGTHIDRIRNTFKLWQIWLISLYNSQPLRFGQDWDSQSGRPGDGLEKHKRLFWYLVSVALFVFVFVSVALESPLALILWDQA